MIRHILKNGKSTESIDGMEIEIGEIYEIIKRINQRKEETIGSDHRDCGCGTSAFCFWDGVSDSV